MPLTGEYEPSTSDWARENAETYMSSGGTAGTELNGRPVILRDCVVRDNEWARALQYRPGVHVVTSVDEVLNVVAVLRPNLDDVLTGVLTVDQ